MTLQVRTLEGCALVLVPGVATALTAGTPRWEWSSVAPFIVEALPLSLVWAAAFYYRDLRAAPLPGGYSRLIRRVLQSCSLAFALYLLVSLILEAATPIDSPAPRTFLLTLGMMGLLALPLNETTQVLLRRRGRRVLVFGQGALASQVLEELAKLPALYQTVVTVPADPAPSGGAQASHERLEHAISAHRPDTIILALTDRRNRLPVEYLVQARLRGIRVEDAVDVYERLTQKLALEFLTPSAFLYTKQLPKSALYLHLHRSLSVVLAVLGLIASAPLMALIALAVKLDSPGPVFFRQQRVGWRDRVFLLYKFRTMRNAEPAVPHSTWHRDDAPRVTRVGRWLRRSRLDELPQFWNILRGDMNFIGPRPEMVQNVEQMAQEIPFYRLRHIIRPGITGWAQVKNGYAVDRETVWEKIRYDLYYLKNMGFALDLTILFESVKVILFGEHGDTNF